MKRPSGRANDCMRPVHLETGINKYAEGSCRIHIGDTQVLCTASVEEKIPPWLRHAGHGWITAEYGMLPRATGERNRREATAARQGGRTLEIQRLIGRALRAVSDLKTLGEIQIILDCDVLQADGGTRTAAITGAYVALYQACRLLHKTGAVQSMPLREPLAAVSCGLYKGSAILDLDYTEDSAAQADANFVLTRDARIIEIQTTAESKPFSQENFAAMFDLARQGVSALIAAQESALEIN